MIDIYCKCIICISFKQQTTLSFDKKLLLYLHLLAKKDLHKTYMLDIGSKISQLRKAKNWSQEELAKEVNSSRVMIGNYERNINTPSIEVIIKVAKAFEVSIDFLLGEGLNSSYDKETIRRLDELEKLPTDEKNRIFDYIDLVIRDHKTKKAYS